MESLKIWAPLQLRISLSRQFAMPVVSHLHIEAHDERARNVKVEALQLSQEGYALLLAPS